MTEKIVYSYNNKGIYNGEVIARISPLEEGVYLYPANTTDLIPTFQEGYYTKFVNNEWILELIPIEKYYKKISDGSIELLTAPDLNLYVEATQGEIDIWNFNKLKAEKKAEIQISYDNKVAEGFIYQGNLFDLDQNTITIIHRKLQNQIYLFETNFTFSNRNKDVIDFIDAEGFKGLYQALSIEIERLALIRINLKKELLEATTEVELNNINIIFS